MRIHVLYFAVFRERLGQDDEMVELGDGTTVGAAVDALAVRHPAIASLRGRFRCAVNQEFTEDAHVLVDGDELALIPPVAGGMDKPSARADGPSGPDERHAVLRDDALSLDRCMAAVAGAGMGGIVTFTGMVRRYSRGVAIARLEYEASPAMATREMKRLCDEIEAEIPGTRLAVEHRLGTLQIGDLAVVIAAAAPHRSEAFTACRAMIDRLKDRVPIWKKELGEDGAVWIGLGP